MGKGERQSRWFCYFHAQEQTMSKKQSRCQVTMQPLWNKESIKYAHFFDGRTQARLPLEPPPFHTPFHIPSIHSMHTDQRNPTHQKMPSQYTTQHKPH